MVPPFGHATALRVFVDPDLLVTVNAMTGGYVVSDAPDGSAQQPGTPTRPGTGQAAAARRALREKNAAIVTLSNRSLGNGDSGVPPTSTAPGSVVQPARS